MKIKVLYEDNHLIAVEKPSGLLTQGDETGDASLMDEVKKYLKEKYKKPGNVYLRLLHRLDRPVSGVILFAKTSKGASRLSAQFRNREVEKIYHAIVAGRPKQKKRTIISYIAKNEKERRAVINKNGEKAELSYEAISSNGKYSLLKIRLGTGRFHQIRAQLAAAGHPILGDLKYGAPAPLRDKTVALCATSLSFNLASKAERKTITLPIPRNWTKYIKMR